MVLSGSCSRQPQKNHNCAPIPLEGKLISGAPAGCALQAGFYHAVGHSSGQTDRKLPTEVVAPPYMRKLSIWNSALSSQEPEWVFEENYRSPKEEGGSAKTPCSHGHLHCNPYVCRGTCRAQFAILEEH